MAGGDFYFSHFAFAVGRAMIYIATTMRGWPIPKTVLQATNTVDEAFYHRSPGGWCF